MPVWQFQRPHQQSLQEETVLSEASPKVIKIKICLESSERYSHPKAEASLSHFPRKGSWKWHSCMNWVHTSLCSSKMHHPQGGRVTQALKGLFIGSKWEGSFAAVESVETQPIVPSQKQVKAPGLLPDETWPGQILKYSNTVLE